MKNGMVAYALFLLVSSVFSLPTTKVAGGMLDPTTAAGEVADATNSPTTTELGQMNDSKEKEGITKIKLEKDVIVLIPEAMADGQNGQQPNWTPNLSRSLGGLQEYAEYDDDDKAVDEEDDEDMEAAEAIVFRPLFRYRQNQLRRRVYRQRPSRRHSTYRRCAPCPWNY